jgi:hypothetical protein
MSTQQIKHSEEEKDHRVYLEADVVAGLVDHLARLPQLLQRAGDERLEYVNGWVGGWIYV